jgi:hypothetical protein
VSNSLHPSFSLFASNRIAQLAYPIEIPSTTLEIIEKYQLMKMDDYTINDINRFLEYCYRWTSVWETHGPMIREQLFARIIVLYSDKEKIQTSSSFPRMIELFAKLKISWSSIPTEVQLAIINAVDKICPTMKDDHYEKFLLS